MNIPALGLGAAGLIGSNVLGAIWSTSPKRVILWQAKDAAGKPAVDQSGRPAISSLAPQVVVEEQHLDQLRLTQHPVEVGAQITDHAFKLPARLRIRAGWSFANAAGIAAMFLPVPPDTSYLTDLYDTLLKIQTQRAVVTVVTGKRRYTNLMLETLAVRTDEKSENVLWVSAEFQEVLFARVQTVTVPDPSVQKAPQATAAPVNNGNVGLRTITIVRPRGP
ncbi:hypothetical protein Sp245p_26240 (plasmid) [Azospirillum baldaniorum]|uniref:Dit-like phage tail protein N-terminal domain-containing protein n=1 Tax=Azospirillum baldaniorum TaxID=1064539 RepID=A0A9P1JZS7_9PROT|nr:hypothetical protein [Azospirillum baldaniorum]AWJ93324.1 hypothetical protein Sp245p_26240 [Azospirillum baldaniorum]TWA78026.1 hypothetical protein FBZ85_106186 [Azospirillum brasilense]CCD02872.1 exported protein of unknown function [Azospirillum baldaniorum]